MIWKLGLKFLSLLTNREYMPTRINPFTDFGFKYIFGKEDSKIYLIDFLNSLLADEPGFEPIADIVYTDKERVGDSPYDRGVIYDINCVTDTGRRFMVEMQNSRQGFFIDRSIYYYGRAVNEQGLRGEEWNYRLVPVYIVAFLNFNLPELGKAVRTDAALCNLRTGKPISDKIRFIYIQLRQFKKHQEECADSFDWWMYNLVNMESMEQLAFTQQHNLFRRLSDITSYAALDHEERRRYDADLKAYRDLTNSLNFAKEEGLAEGRAEGMAKGRAEGMAKGRAEGMRTMITSMFENGMKPEEIARIAKTSVEDIRQILKL